MKFYNTDPLCHIFNLSACESLWKIARKKVNNLSANKEFYQFQVACVSYLILKQSKAFKERIDRCLSTQFDGKTPAHIRKKLKHKSTCAIDLIMFYKNSKLLISKVRGSIPAKVGFLVGLRMFSYMRTPTKITNVIPKK